MKLLAWLFNLSQRHRVGINKYRNGSWGARLLALVITLLFALLAVGAGISLRNYSVDAMVERDLSEFVLSLFLWMLVIGLGYATVEYAAVYSVVGLIRAICGDSDCPRLVDVLFSLLQLAVAVGTAILFFGILGGGLSLPF